MSTKSSGLRKIIIVSGHREKKPDDANKRGQRRTILIVRRKMAWWLERKWRKTITVARQERKMMKAVEKVTWFVWYPTISECGTRPFYGGAAHESRLIHGRCKNSWTRQHSPNGTPQASSNKLSPAEVSKVLGGWPLWGQGAVASTQPPGMNARW